MCLNGRGKILVQQTVIETCVISESHWYWISKLKRLRTKTITSLCEGRKISN